MARLSIPLLWIHPCRCRHQRTTRGQCVWLRLHWEALSFSTPSRFIPSLSCVPVSAPQSVTSASRHRVDLWGDADYVLRRLADVQQLLTEYLRNNSCLFNTGQFLIEPLELESES